MIVATRPTPAISPTIAPITRTDAFVRTGRRHARQLADTIPLLSERPVVIMPTSPTSTAIQRVLLGCVSAELICSARLPVMPTSSGVGVGDEVGDEAEQADDEEQQRHEEQEQPERQGAADDGAGGLAVALVDAQPDVEQRAVAVASPATPRRGPGRRTRGPCRAGHEPAQARRLVDRQRRRRVGGSSGGGRRTVAPASRRRPAVHDPAALVGTRAEAVVELDRPAVPVEHAPLDAPRR